MKDNGEKAGITVLVVEPLKEPYVKTISSGLKSLQVEVRREYRRNFSL